MRKFYTLTLLFSALLVMAQPPVNYYNSATGTGYTLKTQLHNIIDDHNDRGYAGLYTTYQTSDRKANGKVWDMYSNCDFTFGSVANGGNQDNGTEPAGECVFFNREHTVTQSYFASEQPMYSDAHFVLPTDKVVNGKRNDFPFGRVATGTASYTSGNGSKLGPNVNSGYSAGYSQTVFEPIDEYKGDIARVILYFATRYETQLAGFYNTSNSTVKAMFDGSENHVFSNTFLNILLTWHIQDPVSAKEIARNNAIYSRQNNRNPYIDRPEFATAIWGAPLSTETYDALAAAVSVYPNPSNDKAIHIYSEADIDLIQLVNINGQLMIQVQKPVANDHNYSLENLPQGFYFLKLTSGTQSTTKKVLVN